MQRLCQIEISHGSMSGAIAKNLADAKESETSRAVGAGIGSIAKKIVDVQQPTAVMEQEPSPSSPSSSSPTAPVQEPTQNIQNEQMDSPMEMGAQEHREQRKVRLNETSSSEMSKRPLVKAKSAHPSMTAPMVESLESPSSKDETTTGSLYAIDGIDVVTPLDKEEDVWQFEMTKTCAREIQFQDGEQESAAIVDREDPSVSKIINVCGARTGEKLNSKEMLKRKAKEVQKLDEFEVKNEICQVGGSNDTRKEGTVKMGGNTKGSKQALVRVVWSQPSRRQCSVGIKDQVCQEMWMVE